MRWVFWTLVFLNFLVFAAQWLNKNYEVRPAAEPVQLAGKSLLLLSEVAGNVALSPPESSPVVVAEDLDALCLMVGPAAGQGQAQELLQLLRQEGLAARVVAQEVAKAPDYWVYLPPLADRNAAIDVLRELQQIRKIDSFLISQGPLANGISLGLFKNRDAAVSLQEQRIAEGLDARLIEVERNATEFWVLISGDLNEAAAQKVNELLVSAKFPGERRQIYCKSVASAEKVP